MQEQTDSLRIELLGGFRIACGASEIPDDGWRLAKARSLVKIVALAPGQSILREQLVELLWPELDPDAGANNLHQALHIARRTLGTLLPDAQPNRILRLQRGVLSLEPPAPVWIDVEQFEDRARELASADDTTGFYDALDIYRGDLLPDDLYEDWAAERRIVLHEQYLALLDRLARLHRARREATQAIDALRRIVAIESDREEAHRGLIELYALTGRRQQALRQYERLREILERDLDLEPEPETDELHAAILTGEYPAEPWDVEQVAESQAVPRPQITETIAEFLSRAGDFVGRSEELGSLQGALARVIEGQGEIILVAGEAGIGKTRMSEEFLRYAGSQGVRTLWGRCYEGDGAPAYWPWVQVVRGYLDGRSTAELRTVMGPGAADIARIAPELRERLPDLEDPPPLDPDGERFRLFDSMTTFLKNAAARAPLALIIDDLHSADRSSLLLLEFLAREVAETGLLIIGAYRHVEVERGHPLTRTLGQLARHEPHERITLDGLGVADIDRYIALVTGRATPEGLADAIHQQSEGNPFFVREIVALLIEEERLNNPEDVRSWRLTIPHGIRETIALRTARLSDTAHRVLTTASVSGRDFELPIVAQVADLDELDTLDALEEALGTGLIVESPPVPGGFRFTHAITRQTLYDDLSQARRLRMHLRTGEAIEGLVLDEYDSVLPELAYHFSISAALDSHDKAIKYNVLAGKQAIGRVAYSEASSYFRIAIDALDLDSQTSTNDRVDLLLLLGEALRSAGDTADAIQTYQQAVELARNSQAHSRFGQAAADLADTAFQSGDLTGKYLPLLQEANEILEERDHPLRVRILSSLVRDLSATEAVRPDVQQQVRHFADEALRVAREVDDREAMMLALISRQYVGWDTEGPAERLHQLEEVVKLAQDQGNINQVLNGHAWRIFHFVQIGDIQAANRENEAYFHIAKTIRRPYNLWSATFRKAMHALVRGRFDEAEELAERALIIGRRAAPQQASEIYFLQLTMIRREQDRHSEAIDVSRSVAIADHRTPSHTAIMRALVASEIGDVEQSQEMLDQLVADRFDSIPHNLLRIANLALLACISSEIGHRASSEVLLSMLSSFDGQVISGGGNTVVYGATSYYLGLLTSQLGYLDEAVCHFDVAATAHAAMGAWPLAAHSQFGLAVALLARDAAKDQVRVREALEIAARTAAELGMTRLQRRIASIESPVVTGNTVRSEI